MEMTTETILPKDDVFNNKRFTCINCGQQIGQLYKTYTSSVVKLMKCDYCMETADKYIEFEPILTFIDIILLSSHAYRHILLNTAFKNHWKLMIIVTVVEAYYKWMELSASLSQISVDPFVAETGFYYCLLNILTGNLIFYFLIKLFTPELSYLLLWKALTLAACSKFLYLPITIWKENLSSTNISLHIFLMNAHFVFALAQIYIALTFRSRRRTGLVISVSIIAKLFLMSLVSKQLDSLNLLGIEMGHDTV